MKTAIIDLPQDEWNAPAGVSFVRVDRETGNPTDERTTNSYFEIFLDEDI